MAALHEALNTLAPVEFEGVPQNDLADYLQSTFRDAQLLIDSIPIPPPPESAVASSRLRASTTTSSASSASTMSLSDARPSPPAPEVAALQKQWGSPVRLNASQNPLGMSVYKLAGKDGNGAWFARRSVHEGLGFKRWKRGLEREFPETMKVQGGPGEGNIRGIGGERRVEYKEVEGVGRLAVYHLSAQFPGPTTPRDFVTLLLTTDSALTEGCGGVSEENGIPRHFMVVSKPCIHPDTPERAGFIRGQYQSVEFIREIPVRKPLLKSASTSDLSLPVPGKNGSNSSALSREVIMRNAQKSQNIPDSADTLSQSSSPAAKSDTDLPQNDTRKRGKTISFAGSRGASAKGEHFDIPGENDDGESNPVEWIMLTRSDPGGSVPRFMVERGTPSSIVADASKFLDWACSEIEDDENEESEVIEGQVNRSPRRSKELHDYQTNGHLAGIDGARDPVPGPAQFEAEPPATHQNPSSGGLFGFMAGAANAAGSIVAAHTPAIIASHIPGHATPPHGTTPDPIPAQAMGEVAPLTTRRYSTSSSSSDSSAGSFASALSGTPAYAGTPSVASVTSSSKSPPPSMLTPALAAHEKQYQKLAAQKAKLAEKLRRTREKELSRKSADSSKEAAAQAKAEERHRREVEKEERKYREGVKKLEARREKEERKIEERRRKGEEKDERVKLRRELEEARAECEVLRVEKRLLAERVGELQRENTRLVSGLGRLGEKGEEVLRGVRAEIAKGGSEWSLPKRPTSLRSLGSGIGIGTAVEEGEKRKENVPLR